MQVNEDCKIGKGTKEKIRQTFDYNGSFYYYSQKAFDILLVSVYWILGSLLVVTAGAASAALYYTVIKSVRGDSSSVTESFWHSFKDSLRQGIPHGLLTFGLLFLFLWNYGIIHAKMDGNAGIGFSMLYLLLAFAVLSAACWVFPLLSRYRMPFGWYTKAALFSLFRYFPRTILLVAIHAAGYYLVYRWLPTILFVPGTVSLLGSFFAEKVVSRYAAEDKTKEAVK